METPSYYSVITADILFNEKLSDSEKILAAHIATLQNKSGWCYASNSYFAKVTNVHKNTVGNRINKMKKLGLIDVQIIYKDGSKEVEKRLIRLIPINHTVDTPINHTVDTPINHTVEDNSTSNNITRTTTSKSKEVVEVVSFYKLNKEIIEQFLEDLASKKEVKNRSSYKGKMRGLFVQENNEQIIEQFNDWKVDFNINKLKKSIEIKGKHLRILDITVKDKSYLLHFDTGVIQSFESAEAVDSFLNDTLILSEVA